MRTVIKEKSSRQRAASEQMTDAKRIQQRFSSGTLKSELRTASEAIWIAKALDQQLKDAVKNPEDYKVHLAYLTPDLSILSTLLFREGQEQELLSQLTGAGRCAIMVGLIFGIKERDAEAIKKHGEGLWLLGTKPFLGTELVRSVLKQRIEEGGSSFQIN